ncbi:hypothetical protein CVD28_01085 [Bacillus sp. M6-12]|uniref:hypothetical protein n=1 Tax=Bacillus sp. M6-12 TaxID=2054166 RepID=UPI000C7652A2|nr:hypothetical protein [Bacillus sp. M6-12]PLS19028.1 hypothetical protein CVD28_01085 [Bacillus sp. M6-12]
MNYKSLVYPTYNQNFDRMVQMFKEQKSEIGIEELFIFLFEKDSVWNETCFSKYQKGILVSSSLSPIYEEGIQSFLSNHSGLNLCHVDIPECQMNEFMNIGKVYPI